MKEDLADNIAKAQSEVVFLIAIRTTGNESESENRVIADDIRKEIADKYGIDIRYLES